MVRSQAPASDGALLIVDDDRELCAMLVEYLEAEGERAVCEHDGARGLVAARSGAHPLVVLDVMLPESSGFEVLASLREGGERVPVIMLTARGDDGDKIRGLEAGADDYLAKPFNPRELLARIRAVLRRSGEGAGESDGEGAGDGLSIDAERRVAYRDGQRLALTGVELEMLRLLSARTGEVVSRDALSEQALGRAFDPRDRSVDIHISSLRRKLHAPGDDGSPIRTVRGEGYLLLPVRAAARRGGRS
ncbi:MAG: response regulator transcription factor [Myxococcales bacterium]|nr:response regulator transcription factor [Myxococcales bacterium]